MAGKTITHRELDGLLDLAAADSERFTELALELVEDFDRRGVDLEITDPMSWRKDRGPAEAEPKRVALHSQLRHEIESMEHLDREPEAKLARRIEFARLRLDKVLLAHGMEDSDLEGGMLTSPAAYLASGHIDCTMPPRVCRLWMELHALRTEMVERNLYLVLINVERYSHTTASRVDLIQEGAAALFRAVDGFNWRRELLFRTYAVHWLNQAFRSYLYNFSNTVRVPVYLQKAMKHINLAIARLGDRNATVEEIAKEAGLGENLVATALGAARGTHSLDTPLGDDGDGAGLSNLLKIDQDVGPYTTDLEDISLEQGISQALNRLSDRERYVVRKRFGIGHDRSHTLAEVAGELGVSLERVRQIQVRAISKLNTPTLRKAIDPFLH